MRASILIIFLLFFGCAKNEKKDSTQIPSKKRLDIKDSIMAKDKRKVKLMLDELYVNDSLTNTGDSLIEELGKKQSKEMDY